MEGEVGVEKDVDCSHLDMADHTHHKRSWAACWGREVASGDPWMVDYQRIAVVVGYDRTAVVGDDQKMVVVVGDYRQKEVANRALEVLQVLGCHSQQWDNCMQ